MIRFMNKQDHCVSFHDERYGIVAYLNIVEDVLPIGVQQEFNGKAYIVDGIQGAYLGFFMGQVKPNTIKRYFEYTNKDSTVRVELAFNAGASHGNYYRVWVS